MQRKLFENWHSPNLLISAAVLAVLLVYTFGILFIAPYSGFYFNPADGMVVDITPSANPEGSLEMGDMIERIGSTPIEDYLTGRRVNPFKGVQPGQTIELQVWRDGKSITIQWIYPGFNRHQFLSRFLNIWWLAYVFWAIGMFTQLFMRPKDTQWRLFVSSNYLTALFIIFGSISSLNVLGGSTLLRVTAWLLLPVYIHFHWIFPASFRRLPRWLKMIFYFVFLGLAAAELFLLAPDNLYFFAVMLAFGGSILLLILHFILQPDHRREVIMLVIAASFALFPAIGISAIASSGQLSQAAPLALLTLPILPSAYFYILYRRNLGGLELRANRGISLSIFLILLGTVLFLNIGFLGSTDISREVLAFGGTLVALTTTFLGIQLFPAFQTFIERRLLGIKLPPEGMVENFSARIVTSTTLPDLMGLLKDEVFPSLLIRQYAFVKIENSSAKIMLSENAPQEQVREDVVMDILASSLTGKLIPSSGTDQPLEWVCLILPLRFGSDLIGAWLLGRRDPDDLYPQAEHPVLQSLANQTAVAMSNIIQTERLKTVYEVNINRYEEERLRLAHDLHDSILNEMAALFIGGEAPTISPKFQQGYEALTGRLREIVSDLRPPMLTFGLKIALEGIADNLSERSHDTVEITTDIQTDGEWRYPESVENNIYRIVQEACENAMRHGRPKRIVISGRFGKDELDLFVEDNGIGFDAGKNITLDKLVRYKHFGLAGMLERAITINADLHITSAPGRGAQLHIKWKLPAS